jgi:transcriptional regulator with XRE-family HTH domain
MADRGARKSQGTKDRKHRRAAAAFDPESVAHKRRRPPCLRRWDTGNVLRMADAEQPSTEWGRYLRRMTSRPGWSVAELARRSDIARQTIFEYIRSGAEGVSVGTIRRIADALGDDFLTALLAAGNISLVGQDAQLAQIITSDLDPDEQAALIEYVEAVREAQRQAMRAEIDVRLRRRSA